VTEPTVADDPTILPVDQWRTHILSRVQSGDRFSGLFGAGSERSCVVTALLVTTTDVDAVRTEVLPNARGVLAYPSLSPDLPAAFWYERALHDLSGVVPENHPRLDPLLLRLDSDAGPPLPGTRSTSQRPTTSLEATGPVDVGGHGMFTLPYGPVRSGVFESIEFLIETPGEDIPHLNVRPHYKHRGIAKQFERRTPRDGVLVAERVEGISSVAHALAFCHAIEAASTISVDPGAALVRVLLAELERIANHLDVTMRLADAAGLAVAMSRFAWHKETVLRLVSTLCGNRFGRGIITVGGLTRAPGVDPARLAEDLSSLHHKVRSDLAALQASASFLDRVRGTGPLSEARAVEHGALGPIGRASGLDDDARRNRPYDAYGDLDSVTPPSLDAGDALARARVRWHEIDTSMKVIVQALTRLAKTPVSVSSANDVVVCDGFGIGWAESAQGEVLYSVEIRDGHVGRCFARSASFHNLLLFHDVFAGDIFTDFPFIEASFGLGYAGVAM